MMNADCQIIWKYRAKWIVLKMIWVIFLVGVFIQGRLDRVITWLMILSCTVGFVCAQWLSFTKIYITRDGRVCVKERKKIKEINIGDIDLLIFEMGPDGERDCFIKLKSGEEINIPIYDHKTLKKMQSVLKKNLKKEFLIEKRQWSFSRVTNK